jgi:RNA polymerase sigma-70 factor, ECF subfamily
MLDEHQDAAQLERAHFFSWVTTLVQQHRARLVAIAQRKGLPAQDALDCVQDAFFTFMRMPDACALTERTEEAGRLLATLVSHVALNLRRKLERRAAVPEFDLAESASDLPTPEALFEEAETRVSLIRCVQQLSLMQQAVIRMKLLEDRPGEEISTLLNLSPENVRILQFRARQRLKECLVLAMKDEERAQLSSPPDSRMTEHRKLAVT